MWIHGLLITSLMLWSAGVIAQTQRPEIIPCFSDPETSTGWQGMSECPKQSYMNRGRCRDAYIDHYKEMVLWELGGHNTELHIDHLPLHSDREKKNQHRIPRNSTVCIDFDENCYCTWMSVNEDTCQALPHEATLLYAGDSMIRNMMIQLQNICPKTAVPFFKKANADGIFFPNSNSSNLLNITASTLSAKVLIIGFALHHMSLEGRPPTHYQVWKDYELWIRKTLDSLRDTRKDLQIVWHQCNSVVNSKYIGKYESNMARISSGDPDNRVKGTRGYNTWQELIANSMTRIGVLGINRRAMKVIEKEYPEVQIIDSFQITDFMERYTNETDGRHFRPFVRLKLSILFTMNKKLLIGSGS